MSNEIDYSESHNESNEGTEVNDDEYSQYSEESDQQNEENEVQKLKSTLEEIPFNQIIKAKKRIENESIKKNSYHSTKSKKQLKDKYDQKNKLKSKDAPKEMSAKLKPNKYFQFRQKFNSRMDGIISRDPRFDSTGKFKADNYSFLEEKAKSYLKDLNDTKKDLNLNEDETIKINMHRNKTLNFIHQQNTKKFEKDLNTKLIEKNLKRKQEGKEKIFLKKKDIAKLSKEENIKSLTREDEKKYLKKKLKKESSKRKSNTRPFLNYHKETD